MACDLYGGLVKRYCPGAAYDYLFPGDLENEMPTKHDLEKYHGVLWTGCNLTIFDDQDMRVCRQVDLARIVYEIGIPQFGSCWGVQMAVFAAGGICRPFFLADGYPHYAHNRIDITADQDDDFDDTCTRVDAEADVRIVKLDDLAGFMECDPVGPDGIITYDIIVTNDGPSDAAQVYVVDQLADFGVVLDPDKIEVEVIDGRGELVAIEDDGRITIVVGDDPNYLGDNELGRLNAGSEPVQIRIKVLDGQAGRLRPGGPERGDCGDTEFRCQGAPSLH